jgi:UDP-N-acetylglucosamine:LPS N-acetylglucosamine transferase
MYRFCLRGGPSGTMSMEMSTQSMSVALSSESKVGTAGRVRVLAVASGGGHWVQLRKLAPVLEEHDVAYLTVNDEYRPEVGDIRFYTVNDATQWNKAGLIRLAIQVFWVLLRERPDVVLSTGAAPGFFAIVWAKLFFGARTVWIDSAANSERLSSSGEKVGRFADLWLTQWEAVSRPVGPHYMGRVL